MILLDFGITFQNVCIALFMGGLLATACLSVIGCLLVWWDGAVRFVDKALPYPIGAALIGALGLFLQGVGIV